MRNAVVADSIAHKEAAQRVREKLRNAIEHAKATKKSMSVC